ncbi:MAG: hypothetical protein ABH814_02590 [bacterium]
MNFSLNELMAKRAELRAELAQVEAAITAFADASAVRIRTHKNIRNTGGVTTNPAYADECLMVYFDQELTVPADKSDHEGFVVRAAWEQFKLENPDYYDFIEGC